MYDWLVVDICDLPGMHFGCRYLPIGGLQNFVRLKKTFCHASSKWVTIEVGKKNFLLSFLHDE